VKSLAVCKALEKDFRKAVLKYGSKAEEIKKRLKNIAELEKENSRDVDAVSNEFGHLMEEIFLYKRDEWEKILRKIGFYAGKYIYFLDAYEDMEKDEKSGSYNPFNNLEVENKREYAKELSMLNLSFLSNEIEKLPLEQDKGIIDNIIYSGILNKINDVDKEKIK
jgi:hypothetical protein